MNRRFAVQTLLAGSAGLFLPRSLRAQSQQEDFTLRSDVVLVLLDVSVKDHSGRFVPGLSREHFTVLEDGKPQTITVFDGEDRPVDVGILVDQSRSMTPKWNHVLTAAETLIEESNRQDEVFIVHFNDRVTAGLPPDVPFSGDIQQLRQALTRGKPAGKTALNDAVIMGLDHLTLGARDKKVLVLISDGGDNASNHNRKETLDRVEAGAATIYAVGLYDEEEAEHDTGFLRRLANISGGEAYFPSSAEELAPLCRRIAKEIRTRYTIGYVPHSGKPLRSIEVRATADHHHLKTRARSHYRYDEIAAKK